jgi:hypothetical protein
MVHGLVSDFREDMITGKMVPVILMWRNCKAQVPIDGASHAQKS